MNKDDWIEVIYSALISLAGFFLGISVMLPYVRN